MDLEVVFLLIAVIIVLLFAWYIQVYILPGLIQINHKPTGLFKARIIDDDDENPKKKWEADSKLIKEAEKIAKQAVEAKVLLPIEHKSLGEEGLNLTLKLLGADMSKEEESNLALADAVIDAIVYLLTLNVDLKEQHEGFQKIEKFNKQLHSSNLLSKVKIEEEVLKEKLEKIKVLDEKKEVITKFKIVSEHIKMIDQIFSDTGLLENYMDENAMMLHSRFLEIRALSRELFNFAYKLNPEILEEGTNEELEALMTKNPEYFKIKTEE
ncbi:MAG: hypothetical protein MK033_09010 [Candidatus Caenarcaniphilales bacterium]|nr:hypothetical protein [Candidatus Caenarcaniphilales bacterium]